MHYHINTVIEAIGVIPRGHGQLGFVRIWVRFRVLYDEIRGKFASQESFFPSNTEERVPTPNVSVVDLTFMAARDTTVEEINEAIRTAANGDLKGVLGFTDAPNVSMDFNHDPHSSIFHMDQTKVMEGRMCRILSWYDNEWGFSNRMADTAVAMGRLI